MGVIKHGQALTISGISSLPSVNPSDAGASAQSKHPFLRHFLSLAFEPGMTTFDFAGGLSAWADVAPEVE
jgi:hypothetical protein